MGGRYAKERMNPRNRMIDRAIDLRTRLGQTEGGTVARFPTKPKWMRWHTYLRLRAKSLALEKKMWGAEWACLPASVRSKMKDHGAETTARELAAIRSTV